MISSLVFVIVGARMLGVARFGGYEISMMYGELAINLVASAASILMTREIAKARDKISQHLSATLVIVSILALIGVLCLCALPLLTSYAPDTAAAIRLASLFLIPGALCMLLEAAFVAVESAHYVTKGTAIEGVLRVVLGVTVLLLGYGIVTLVLVSAVCRGCLALYYWFSLRRVAVGLHWSLDRTIVRDLLRDGPAFVGENWLSAISGNLAPIILSVWHGEFATGLYFAATKIMRLGRIVALSYTAAVFPYMSRLYEQSRDALHELGIQSLKYTLAMVLPVIVTISVLADQIILLLYDAEFAGSIPILRVVAWTLMLTFVNPFLSRVLFARGEQANSVRVATARLVSQLVFAFLLIPRWSGVGAAWAVLLAASVAGLVNLFYTLRGHETGRAISTLLWAALPAVSLAVFLVAMRDLQLVVLLFVAAILYIGLLFALRVVSWQDLRALQRLM